ncbi:hypothetical protein PR048_020614 [Dryococelus australis]|uniref:Uncharacterized protein n=1 Tax=Dryococelus australis TaxID=614101 RepID=A0ABQ9H6S1_9NEOP|nr:hypothetical protein PR048_020614 [Dryococelus australis]
MNSGRWGPIVAVKKVDSVRFQRCIDRDLENSRIHFGARASGAERLACSPPTKANRVQSPAGPLPDFRNWEPCRTMPLVGGFSRGSPFSPASSIRRCSILTSFHPHWLSLFHIFLRMELKSQQPDEHDTTGRHDDRARQNITYFIQCSQYHDEICTTNESDTTESRIEPTFVGVSGLKFGRANITVTLIVKCRRVGFVGHHDVKVCGNVWIHFAGGKPGPDEQMTTKKFPVQDWPHNSRYVPVPSTRHHGWVLHYTTPVPNFILPTGAAVAEQRSARSPPTKANRFQSTAGSPDFRKWESCQMMPLVGGFSRGSPVSLVPSFRRRSTLTPIVLIGSPDLAAKSRPNLFGSVTAALGVGRSAVGVVCCFSPVFPYGSGVQGTESRSSAHRPPPKNRSRKNKFFWKLAGLSDCSKTCGGGTTFALPQHNPLE